MEEIELEKKDYGKDFENEVKIFLEEKLKFSDVKGGQDFHIAPNGEKNQIDACGRYKDILFVFECKAAGRKVKKNLRQDILATKERARMVLEGYKTIPEYSQCKFVKFIFITKKIEIPESEKELFKETHFWYADENLLEYYSELYEKIGEYAVFNFLADYGIRPPENEQLNVAALKTKIGKYVTYSFYANPKELLKFSYVARRRSQKEDFYQRMLDKNRIRKIQQFLDNGGIFPTNVIISLKEGDKNFVKISGLESKNHSEVGTLTIKNSYSACWIIDGQHRLYSFSRAHSENLIPLLDTLEEFSRRIINSGTIDHLSLNCVKPGFIFLVESNAVLLLQHRFITTGNAIYTGILEVYKAWEPKVDKTSPDERARRFINKISTNS